MKKLLVLAIFLSASTAAWPQQRPIRIFTDPAPPPRELLDKLDLVLAWRQAVPLKGVKDGFYHVQLAPGDNFNLLIAQTFDGAVVAINAETGDTLWRREVEALSPSQQPAAYNKQSIFVAHLNRLFILDRDTGQHQLFTVHPELNVPLFGAPLERAPSAGLAADDQHLYICQGDRLRSFMLPNFKATGKTVLTSAGGKLQESSQPIQHGQFQIIGEDFLRAPIPYRNTVSVTSAQGSTAVLQVDSEFANLVPIYLFKAGGPVDGRAGFNNGFLYIPSEDFTLYAIEILGKRVAWRYGGQSPILQSPFVTDKDVFVRPTRSGLEHVDRASGILKWINGDGRSVMAVNQRFVYTRDEFGRMLVIDYQRGKTLAVWEGGRDWVVPIPNELTDRIYLASNDGQIVCLRHRDNIKPLKMTTFYVPPPPSKKGQKKEEDMAPTEDMAPKGDEPMPDKNGQKIDDGKEKVNFRASKQSACSANAPSSVSLHAFQSEGLTALSPGQRPGLPVYDRRFQPEGLGRRQKTQWDDRSGGSRSATSQPFRLDNNSFIENSQGFALG